MPIYKNGTRYHTKEQLKIAKQASALEYALANGYELIKNGLDYRYKKHDSMVFRQDGSWFWNSKGLNGRALDFMIYYENHSYIDAVCLLAGENVNEIHHMKTYETKKILPEKPRVFTPPEHNDSHKRVFAYLTKTRGLSEVLVRCLIRQGIIYETKDYHNAAFVLRDVNGKELGTFLRGTNTMLEKEFKGVALGSDKNNSLFYFGHLKNPKNIYVCEAAIDCISVASMVEHTSEELLRKSVFVSSGGAGHNNVLQFIQHYIKDIETIELCHDNDSAGENLAKLLKDDLQKLKKSEGKEFDIKRTTPKYKDFNEDLLKKNEMLVENTIIENHEQEL